MRELATNHFFGRVKQPPGVSRFGGVQEQGVAEFLNVIFRLLIVVAGLYALLNIILAGYAFMSAGGDPKAIQNAWAKIWQSLVGLLLVVASFVLAAVFGQLLFGDPAAILNPTLIGPGG